MQETNVVLVDKKGVTLVEVLIAMVVLLFVSLAMMQTAMVSIDSNMINVLRTEAISIAEMRMNELRNRPFDDFDLNGASDPDPLTINETINRNIRNVSNFAFNTASTIDTLNTDNKQINIIVTWTWRDTTYTHSITSIVRRP